MIRPPRPPGIIALVDILVLAVALPQWLALLVRTLALEGTSAACADLTRRKILCAGGTVGARVRVAGLDAGREGAPVAISVARSVVGVTQRISRLTLELDGARISHRPCA